MLHDTSERRPRDGNRRTPPVPRPEQLYEVGYFLCRCGHQTTTGKPARPPEVLGVSTWERAYAVFFAALSDVRTLRSFCNTLKNVRDVFDAHVDSGRVGWQQDSDGNSREPQKLTGFSLTVYDRWKTKSDIDLWHRVQQFADLGISQVPNGVFADDMAQLDCDQERIKLKTEGGLKVTVSTRAERNPTVRAAAIRVHKERCMVCNFSFEETYGEWGAGFIEVHHLIPIAESRARETNPETDLAVVCANCHRMIHRRFGVVLTLEELRAKLQR